VPKSIFIIPDPFFIVDLFNTLEDLREEEFKKFKWHLQQDILEGYQSIKVSKLENAERQDTVDEMVKTYQLQGALKVTKKVLEKINRNDLVQSHGGSQGYVVFRSRMIFIVENKKLFFLPFENKVKMLKKNLNESLNPISRKGSKYQE
uniref:Pyrin domain-containing protein n=1 Tax=Sander lucioperca TaxID=283035 RepID=A0A8C9XS58_SANLU